ncbi:tetraacyldisaccharide 4'-kinase [bacterium]|nr:tetraacyldisaccharide 4'-kinase [bacterium]
MGQLFTRALEYMSGSRRGPGAALVRACLRLLSLPYGLATWVRDVLYRCGVLRSRTLSVPVVSVGNLTTGGTGKTPLVVWIARWLAAHGVVPAILSRGYGSTAPDGSDTDEALLFRRFVPDVPHLTGSDRYASGQRAITDHGAQCLVLDDGFQHRQLARDLNIAVVDCLLPFGYGHLLPRGLLREPLSGLRRADLIVLSRCDLCSPAARAGIRERLAARCPATPVVESAHQPVRLTRHGSEHRKPLAWMQGRKVLAFSALGNPEAFPRTLAPLGADVLEHRAFRDHHWYTDADLAALARDAAAAGAEALVTTEKDAVKIASFPAGGPPLMVLAVEFALIDGEGALTDALERLVAS